MARAGPRKVARYGDQFKATAVKLSSLPGVLIQDVAAVLDIHPFMLSLRRRQVREGVIVAKGARLDVQTKAELRRLRETVHRFVTTAGVRYYDALAQDIKSLVDEFVPVVLGDLRSYASEEARRLNNVNVVAELQQKVDAGRSMALAKVHNEIDLFVVSLKNRQASSPDKADSMIFNIYSPVGSILTGANAVAYVTQSIDAGTRERLNEALNAIEDALARIDALPSHPKREVVEVVREVRAELAKPEPNTTKLRSLLSTTATAIQTVGSMKPAYELLKAGLAYLGITLP